MMGEYFERDGLDVVIAHCRGGKRLDFDHVIQELNYLESRRKTLNQDCEKIKQENILLYDILDGVKAYIKLKEAGRLYE